MRKLGWAFLMVVCVSMYGADAVHLDQNWTEADWQWFYTTPQGSKLIPYNWATSLERAGSEELWVRNLERFWFLPNKTSNANRDGLPVGVVKDGTHLGLTCAACHTNQVDFRGTTYQIDGGPTNADLFAFLADLAASLKATAKSPADPKFIRFADRVGGDKTALYADLKKYNDYFQKFIAASTPDVKWGRSRTDAFGMIFNRVTSIDLGIPGNSEKPNAPVSYPFLWDTSWHNVVQWNGSAPNRLVVERLARNVGEVLGVFADIDLKQKPAFPRFYPSTANRAHLLELEDRLAKLRSPKWQAAFGPIDEARRARGEALYNDTKNKNLQCVSCHKIATPGKSQDVVMTKLDSLKTDDAMAKAAATRTGKTGVLKGRNKFILIPFLKFGDTSGSGAMTLHAVIGAILSLDPLTDEPPIAAQASTDDNNDSQDQQRAEVREALEEPAPSAGTTASAPASNARSIIESDLRTLAFRPESLKKQITKSPTLEYKARPLDGIWATAPYLHNGSVPTLLDLLTVPANRPKTFHVGSRELDPVKVGFITEPVDGSFLYDTRIGGNKNTGHDWGTQLSEEQKKDLIEYLKSL